MKVADALQDEKTQLMPVPSPFAVLISAMPGLLQMT